MTASQNVGQQMRRWRHEQERSQRYLARQVSVYGLKWDQGIVSMVERGLRRVTAEELVALSGALGIGPAELLVSPNGKATS